MQTPDMTFLNDNQQVLLSQISFQLMCLEQGLQWL